MPDKLDHTSQREGKPDDESLHDDIQELEAQLKTNGITRRTFLKLFVPTITVAVLDTMALGGLLRENIWRFLTSQEFRDKFFQKLRDGEILNELNQNLTDRINPASQVENIEKLDMRLDESLESYFPNYSILEISNNDETGLGVIIDVTETQIDLVHTHIGIGGILDIQETFTGQDTVILPHTILSSTSSGWKPALYAYIGGSEYLDILDPDRYIRGGAICLDGNRLKIYNASELEILLHENNTQNIDGVIGMPFGITSRVSDPFPNDYISDISRNISVVAATNIADSPRYGACYMRFRTESGGERVMFFNILQSESSEHKEWGYTNRLSIRNLAEIAHLFAMQNGYSEWTIMPTDPDINDSMMLIERGEFPETGLFHEDRRTLLRMPFYLGVKVR